MCRLQAVTLCDPTQIVGHQRLRSFHLECYASLLALLLKCLSAFRPGAFPHLGGARGASAAILPAGQPGQRQRSRRQLPGLSERHICGGQDAPACGQVRHMQRGHRESKAAPWTNQLKLPESAGRIFGLSSTDLRITFVFLLAADKERPGREKVCSLSMQLSADLQSHIAEDRLCQNLLVRKSRFFSFSHGRCDS